MEIVYLLGKSVAAAFLFFLAIGIFMKLFKQTHVAPNRVALVFINGKYTKMLKPGVYTLFGLYKYIYVANLITNPQTQEIQTQEVLSKDGVSFRVSFVVDYIVNNPEKTIPLLKDFSPQGEYVHEEQISDIICREVQIAVKRIIAGLLSSEILEDNGLLNLSTEEITFFEKSVPGVKISAVRAKDVSFPKLIQEVFAKALESKMRASIDLENARAVVATTRALKNAASLIGADPNLKFLLHLETIQSISKKGKNTFVIGETLKS